MMALENLRYGQFKPTAVAVEPKILPGYGGQVEEWAKYRFQVLAVEKKEALMSENERKKFGPLGLRLIERLVGPALQIAKGIGIDKLSETTGVATLIQALEQDLMPQRRQMAVEMHQAGSVPGMLSRQTQEPMSSRGLVGATPGARHRCQVQSSNPWRTDAGSSRTVSDGATTSEDSTEERFESEQGAGEDTSGTIWTST